MELVGYSTGLAKHLFLARLVYYPDHAEDVGAD